MRFPLLSALLLVSTQIVLGDNIFVADHSGKIHTLKYTAKTSSANASLMLTDSHTSASTVHLFKGFNKTRLWSLGTIGGESSLITRWDILDNGTLVRNSDEVLPGVSVKSNFAFNNSGIVTAVANNIAGKYTGGGLYFTKIDNAKLGDSQPITFPNFTIPSTGQQSKTSARRIVSDLSSKYLVAFDSAADKLRVYNYIGSRMLEYLTINLPQGSGPADGGFLLYGRQDTGPIYLYVVNSGSKTIMTYSVKYDKDVLLTINGPISTVSTWAGTQWDGNAAVTESASTGEIRVAWSSGIVTVINSNVTHPNATVAGGKLQLANIASFRAQANGTLTPVSQRYFGIDVDTYDMYLNKTLVTSSTSNVVAVYEYNTTSGRVGDMLASAKFNTSAITHAIWDQR